MFQEDGCGQAILSDFRRDLKDASWIQHKVITDDITKRDFTTVVRVQAHRSQRRAKGRRQMQAAYTEA